MNSNVKKITFAAISIAIATILLKFTVLPLPFWPEGGSVTVCGMLFVSLVGYWFGAGWGISAGVAAGLLQLLLGGFVVHPAQVLLDYPLAFGALGLSGLLCRKKSGLFTGYILGVFVRFVFHFISGIVFFASQTPEGTPVVIYSIVYNSSYLLPEMILTLAVLSVPPFRSAIEQVKRIIR